MPGPLGYKSIQKFATNVSNSFNLIELNDVMGVRVNIDRVLIDLIAQLPEKPEHVGIQILGDGFRAMRKTKFVNIGFRILQENQKNNSFSALATL